MNLLRQLFDWFGFLWPFSSGQQSSGPATHVCNSQNVRRDQEKINILLSNHKSEVEKTLHVVVQPGVVTVTLPTVSVSISSPESLVEVVTPLCRVKIHPQPLERAPKRQGDIKNKKGRATDYPQPYSQSSMETRDSLDLKTEEESWPKTVVKRKIKKKGTLKLLVEETLAEDGKPSYREEVLSQPVERAPERQGDMKNKKVRANVYPQPYAQSSMETRDSLDLKTEEESWPEQFLKRKIQKKSALEPIVEETLAEDVKPSCGAKTLSQVEGEPIEGAPERHEEEKKKDVRETSKVQDLIRWHEQIVNKMK